jgi:hypothetical protein
MPNINGVEIQDRESNVFNHYTGRNKFKVILISAGIAIVAFLLVYFFAKSMITYTLSYVTYGGTSYGNDVETQEYHFLDRTVVPEGLQKEGYYIAGFYSDKDFKNEFKFGRSIWRSKTIYIDWQPGFAVQLHFADGEDTIDRPDADKTGITEKYLKTYHEHYVAPGSIYDLPLVFNDINGNQHYGEQLLWYDNPECTGDPFETKTFLLNDNTKIYGKWFDTQENKFDITEDGTLMRYLGNCFNIKLPSTVKRFKTIADPSQFKAEYWDTSRVYDGTNYSVFDKVLFELESVYVNAECEEINSCAFRNCTNLKTVSFAGDKITTIGQYAFVDCEKLESMKLPTSVTKIDTRAFYRCGIKHLTGLDNVSYVADIAFMNSNIIEIDLTKATYIGSSAFAACYKLKSVTLGGSAVVRSNVYDDSQNIFFSTDTMKIYVPNSLVNAYKTTHPWSVYADKIFAKASS